MVGVLRSNLKRSALVAVSLIVASTLLSGCAESASQDPYASDIAAAAESATSKFERTVLGDGEISREEYEEAVQRYVDCMGDNGVKLNTIEQTGYLVYETTASNEEYEKADPICMKGTKALIEPLYVEMVMNPNKEDFSKLVFDCLTRKKLVLSGATVDDVRAYLEDGAKAPFQDDIEASNCIANPNL